MSKYKLEPDEQEIEDAADEFVPVDEDERKHIAGILARARKNKNVNIRLSEFDLDRIRMKADKEGIPYQTLIASVLHKFVNDQLVDENQVIKTLELIGRTSGK